jgi:hypothetical protein
MKREKKEAGEKPNKRTTPNLLCFAGPRESAWKEQKLKER